MWLHRWSRTGCTDLASVDQSRVLLPDLSRLRLGPGRVIAELLLNDPKRFEQSDGFVPCLVRPAPRRA
jgi:hypothetical protein